MTARNIGLEDDLAYVLAQVLAVNGVPPASLPSEDLALRRSEILLMSEVSAELETVSKFVETVEQEYSAVAGINISNAVANDAALLSFASNQRAAAYVLLELLKSGYGKVVTVRLANGALKKYRIAQANRSVIKGNDGSDLMIVNRLAPVASMLVSAEVGDDLELPGVGLVEVVGVDNLDRSQQCERNDFSKIEYAFDGSDGVLVLKQLRHSFSIWLERWRDASDVIESDRHALLTASDSRRETDEHVPDEISLGSAFYTRTPAAQEELVKRLYGGLVVVEGVAGSGKTSVALGRLKALHDSQFGYEEDGEHHEDAFFKHKHEMVGYVRHAQLIEYLKTTFDDLNLSGVPVKEFKELQNQLILQRAQILQLKLPGGRGGKYSRAPEVNRSQPIEGRMEWLNVIERAMLDLFIAQIRSRLESMRGWISEFEERAFYLGAREVGEVNFQRLMAQAWGVAEKEIESFASGFVSEPRYFSLDRFMVRLKNAYAKIYNIVEDKSYWFLDEKRLWTLKRPNEFKGNGFQLFLGANYDGKFSAQLKKMRERFREQVRRVLHSDSGDDGRWLPKLADWYRATLDSDSVKKIVPEDLLRGIRSRLDANQLTTVDINLLLAIAQIMSRDHEYRDDDQRRLISALATPKFYSSVFVDEVQDFCEIEVFLMSSMANPQRGAVTVVGDFKQQLYSGTVRNLKACFPYAQPTETASAKLLENKRQLPNLAKFSANFRRKIGDESISEQVVPSNIPELTHVSVTTSQLGEEIGAIVGSIPNTKSIAVISPTHELAKSVEDAARPYIEALFRETKHSADNRDLVKRLYVHFTEPRPTKGLEFDVVIVTHFDQFDLDDELAAHGAYVAVSRPRERLVLLNVS